MQKIRRRHACWVLSGLTLAAAVLLFASNGLRTSWRTPRAGSGGGAAAAGPVTELHVMAFNAAKCSFYEGGFSFADAAVIRSRLAQIAAVIERERIDLCFLSEVVMEAGPRSPDQVEELARLCGFARFASSENYSFGWPFLRIRSGNALLSRFPLEPIETVQLPGAKPFWRPTNNRRILWCEIRIAGERILAGAVRNDSFDLATNLLQTRAILDYVGDRPTLLAGDFNAEPDSDSIRSLRSSGRLRFSPDGSPTYPASAPVRRIDDVFAPADWEFVEEHAVDVGMSDHLAVIATFRLAPRSGVGASR